jgi:hypothetical protein
MATSKKPWAIERYVSADVWKEVGCFATSIQAHAVARLLSWERDVEHKARFITNAELAAIARVKERTFFVPVPGEEYDSISGTRHVEVIQVTFDERHPDGYVFYGPGEGEELLSLFVSKYRRTPSKREAHEPR